MKAHVLVCLQGEAEVASVRAEAAVVGLDAHAEGWKASCVPFVQVLEDGVVLDAVDVAQDRVLGGQRDVFHPHDETVPSVEVLEVGAPVR